MSVFIFDLDGVVFEKSSFSRRLNALYGIGPEKTGPFFRDPFVRCQLGQADLKAELTPLLPNWGWRGTVEDFLTFWFDCDRQPMPEMFDLIAELKRKGHRCCLASNQERYRATFLREEMLLHARFDNVFYSCELGFRKPDAGYFAAIERTLSMPGAQLWFCDDANENIEAAQTRGWAAAIFDDVPKLRATLTVGRDTVK